MRSAKTRLLVCGGRAYGRYDPLKDPPSRKHEARCERETAKNVLDRMSQTHDLECIIEGEAPGADQLAKEWALDKGIHLKGWRADWEGRGRAAGPERNQRMLEEGQPTLVLALPGGNGTEDMTRRARNAGLEVIHALTQFRIYTIGASNGSLESFCALLRKHGVDSLVDVRSSPFSSWATQFNRGPTFEAAIKSAGVLHYVYMGDALGGRPSGDEWYDEDGHVLYGLRAAAPDFQEGIKRLKVGVKLFRIALMCAEESPVHCHRRRLVGRVLGAHGIVVEHVRGDGTIVPEDELRMDEYKQLPLIQESHLWRSTRPVRHVEEHP